MSDETTGMPGPNITEKDFRNFGEAGEDVGVLLGTIYVFGTPYHFMFVEVRPLENGLYEPVNDPEGYLEDAERLYELPFQLTEIKGKYYVGFAHPHGR